MNARGFTDTTNKLPSCQLVHYRCAKCNQIVTHEIVHITDDMTHDAHLVKVFTEKSIQVIKKNNVKSSSFWIKHPPSTKIKWPLLTLPILKFLYRKIILASGMAKVPVMPVLGG